MHSINETLEVAAQEIRVRDLAELAIRGLSRMYDEERGLFCHRLVDSQFGLVREGISQRYTMMTVLGLLQANSAGSRSPFDVNATIDSLYRDVSWVDNLGDLGLLLWTSASGQRLETFFAKFDLEGALTKYVDGRMRMTMELSWFLIGLAHAGALEGFSHLARLAHQTYSRLLANQGSHGLFGHSARWHSLAGALRGTIGSFADQVYPIFAMTQYGRVFGIEQALEKAARCANAICECQGPLGQWWWHYDATSGRIVEHYPVYSVHQHAMGPMALFAAQDACGIDFRKSIYRGLNWIGGANELGIDMRDESLGVVWRNIAPANTSQVSPMFGKLRNQSDPGSLQVLRECWPYELGWFLYAFAGREGDSSLF